MDSINSARVKKCPQCGKRSFERLISAAAFHLKGGGWYATDFKDQPKKKSKEEGADAAAEKPEKSAENKTDKDGKGGKEGKDGKPAAKKPPAKSKSEKKTKN